MSENQLTIKDRLEDILESINLITINGGQSVGDAFMRYMGFKEDRGFELRVFGDN